MPHRRPRRKELFSTSGACSYDPLCRSPGLQVRISKPSNLRTNDLLELGLIKKKATSRRVLNLTLPRSRAGPRVLESFDQGPERSIQRRWNSRLLPATNDRTIHEVDFRASTGENILHHADLVLARGLGERA